MKTKVVPLGKKLMLDIPETKAGGIQVVQGQQIQEQGTVIAIGPCGNTVIHTYNVGDIIQFKAWAVDVITIDGKKYYYIDSDSDAICGLVK